MSPQAAAVFVGFYRELALPLAQRHGVTYPAALDRVMTVRLERVCGVAHGH